LSFSLDSLRQILNQEREVNSATQQKLNDNLGRVSKEKAELETQYSLKEKQYIAQSKDLDQQLKNCKKQLDSLQSLLPQPNDDPYDLLNDYLANYIKEDELNIPIIDSQYFGNRSFIITHVGDSGVNEDIYWEVQKTTLYPKYVIGYGSGDWDYEVSYTFLNFETKHEETGLLKGNNSDYLEQEIEKKIEKFILSGK
jgi:hypothetical protein